MKINIDVTASTKKAESAFSRFFSKLKGMNNKFGNINKDANRSAQGIAGLTKSFGGLNQAMGMAGFYAFGYGIKTCIQSAMDMTETINLFNVAMGDTAVKTNEALVAMSEFSGLDLTNLQQAVGSYALLARSMGMSTQQASILSENTAKLAVDLSSLANVPVQQAMADLKSGLVGQSETVYKYGIDVTEAGLKAEAMNQGITKSVRDMSQGEKMALRYSAMIRQSALAHGDFAKTLNSPANQVKILQERLVTLSRAIGTIFIPMLTVVLPYVNAFVSMLTKLAKAIASFFGYEPPPVQNISNNLGDATEEAVNAGDALGDATKEAKKFFSALVGIDEINLLPQEAPSSAGTGAGDGAGQSILPDMQLPSYDNMMAGVKSNASQIETAMQGIIDKFYELSKPILFANWDILKDSVTDLWDALKNLAGIIWDGLTYFYKEILVPLGVWLIEKGLPATIDAITSAFKFLSSVLDALSPVGKAIVEYILKPIGNFVGKYFIDTMKEITTVLTGMADWITEHKDAVKTAIDLIVQYFTSYKDNIVSLYNKIVDFKSNSGNALEGIRSWCYDKINLIIGYWNNFKNAVSGVYDKIKSVKDNVGGFLGGIKDSVWNNIQSKAKTYFDGFKSSVAGTYDKIKGLRDNAGGLLTSIKDNTWNNIQSKAKSYFDNFKNAVAGAYDKVKNVKNGIGGWLTGIKDSTWNNIQDKARKYFDNFKGSVQGAYDKIKNIKKDGSTYMSDLKTNIVNAITGMSGKWSKISEGAGTIWSNIKSSFKGGCNDVMGHFETFINGAIDGFNKIILAWNHVKSNMGIDDWTYPISHISLPRLARGGSLQDGQLFQAGEFGKAEMIGSHKGKTTVMPLENTDFVSAMKEAVFSAVSTAMSSGGSSGGSGDLVLKIGETEFGRVAINSINNVTRKDGRVSLKI